MNALLKDEAGFLWIATANGLSRFNGQNFTRFFHDNDQPGSLAHNYIHSLYSDKKGRLWVSHNEGISLYKHDNHEFTNFYLRRQFRYLHEGFWQMAEDSKGHIWVSNQNGLVVVDPAANTATDPGWANLADATQAYNRLQSSCMRGQGQTMWVAGKKGLFEWNAATRQFQLAATALWEGTERQMIQRVDTLRKEVYVGTYNKGLLVYNYLLKQWKQHRTNAAWNSTTDYDPIYGLLPAPGAGLYCHSEISLGKFLPVQQTFEQIGPSPFLPKANMNCLLPDGAKLWIGTSTGLQLWQPYPVVVNNITPAKPPMGSFATLSTLADGSQFACNYGDIFPYQFWPGRPVQPLLMKAGRAEGIFRFAFLASNGTQWVTTEGHVYKKTPGGRWWEELAIPISYSQADPFSPRNIVEDRAGNLWIRTRHHGLLCAKPGKNQFETVQMPSLGSNQLISGMAYYPQTNTIWIAEEGTGLWSTTAGSQADWVYHRLALGGTGMMADRLSISPDGCIWISDPYNGLLKYDPRDSSSTVITQVQGLLSNSCQNIVADRTGHLWTYAEAGLSKINYKTLQVTNFEHPMLARIQDITAGPDGNLYVATAEGMYKLAADSLTPTPAKATLYLDKWVVNGQTMPLPKGMPILKPGQKDISLYFGVLNLYGSSAEFVEYRWANDAYWQNAGEQHILSFSRLTPGKYTLTLRIQGDTNPSNWLSLTWQIARPWWLQWWVWLAALALAIVATIWLVRLSINRIRRRAALQQRIAETEMAALRAQMNPHFIFNCINSIDSMVQQGEKYNATTYLNKFAKLIRNVLDSSRFATIPLEKDLETLRLYLEMEKLRMDDRFDFSIEAGSELLRRDIRVPSLIAQPFVENAILHGVKPLTSRRGLVKITVWQTGDWLHYMIDDNGIGRHAGNLPALHQSHGISITKSRIDLFNNGQGPGLVVTDKLDDQQQPAGTTVEVRLKIIAEMEK